MLYGATCNNILPRKQKRLSIHILKTPWTIQISQSLTAYFCRVLLAPVIWMLFFIQQSGIYSALHMHLEMSEPNRCNQKKILLWDDTYSLQKYFLVSNVEENDCPKITENPWFSAWLKGSCMCFLTWALPWETAYFNPFIRVEEHSSLGMAKVLCPTVLSNVLCRYCSQPWNCSH